jgi:hypothetical protein
LCTRVALIGEGHLHAASRSRLHLGHEFSYPNSLLLANGRHFQREQMSQRVHRHMHLAAFAALVAVITNPWSAFARGLQGASIHYRGTRLCLFSCHQAQDRTQFVRHGFKASSFHPALCLLMDGRSWGSIRQGQPARTM